MIYSADLFSPNSLVLPKTVYYYFVRSIKQLFVNVANQSTSQSVLTNPFQNSAVDAFVYVCTPSFTHIGFNSYIIQILSGILNVLLKHPSSLGVVSTQSMTRFSPSKNRLNKIHKAINVNFTENHVFVWNRQT